jgi:two-component sensor histidine kinase
LNETPLRILYVDDDRVLARLVERGLGRHGFSVEHAPDATAALARLAQGSIDAVALDHYLGGTTGLELLPQVMAGPAAPAVIYVTGSGDTAIAVAALKAGAADYVAKSISDDFLQLLATALRQAVEKRRLVAAKEKAEREVHEARDRAELLLREVNHRVANSLSLVSSLVGLQANLLREPEAKQALLETQSRIYAIGELHKRLYSAEDIRFVEVDDYLGGLIKHLADSLTAEGSGARSMVDADAMLVPTDKAVSLGVAVTELVTNAFKYAYPAGEAGEVRITLRRLGGEQACLSVRDDGVGWTEGAAAKGTGLGSRIVKAMATSLRAELDYVRHAPGTEVMLTFPLN